MTKENFKQNENRNGGYNSNSTNAKNNKQCTPKNKKNYFKKGGNDPEWHGDAELRKAAANIPWSWATGVDIPVRSNAGFERGRQNMPALFAVRTCSVPGVGDKFTDAVNIAARALYTNIRSKLKSANAYEPADVMLYICNCGDIHQMVSWLHRIFATLPLYSFMNNQFPDNILRMQGVDPEDLRLHALEFRSRVNQSIYKASQIWMPKGFYYIDRCKWIFSHYFAEGPSIKDQIYFFTPGVLRKYTWDAERDYQGMLEAYVPIPTYTDDTHLMTVDSICRYLDDMIEAMVTDSDFQNIAGDLLNCYGESGVETFALIGEDEVELPMVNESVLEQIQNARCLSSVHYMFNNFEDFTKDFSISQDESNNVLVVPKKHKIDLSSYTGASKVNLINGFKSDTYDPIITVHDDPNPDKTMEVTRFSNLGLDYIESGDEITVEVEAAADLVLSFEYGYVDASRKFHVTQFDTNALKGATNNFSKLSAVNLTSLTPYHYHPLVITNVSNGYIPDGNYFGELDVIAPVMGSAITDMNRVDMMGQFKVPNIISVTK